MDFISKNQGYFPLKAVPDIFFLAVILSITSTMNTLIQNFSTKIVKSQLVGIQAGFLL